MNGLYVTSVDVANKSGYKDKILGQIGALSKITDHMYVLASNGNEYFFGEYLDGSTDIIKSITLSKKVRYVRGFINHLKLLSLLRTVIEEFDLCFTYVRRLLPLTRNVIDVLEQMKAKNITVFYEYPTYPWQEEMGSNLKTFGRTSYYLEKKNYGRLLRAVDFVPAIINSDKLTRPEERQKFIKINNGVNVDRITVRSSIPHCGFNMIAVAHVQSWHGLDRVIEGLREYYSNEFQEQVNFWVVGGSEKNLSNLAQLTNKYNLSKYVRFCGVKVGKELDEMFNLADVAVGSLGYHRKSMFRESSLKNREYCARGIPFIIASTDDDFPRSYDFVHYVPHDDTPVNIREVLDFVKTTKQKDCFVEMREYAERNLTWDKKMAPVIARISD